jgi:hypothetical protein
MEDEKRPIARVVGIGATAFGSSTILRLWLGKSPRTSRGRISAGELPAWRDQMRDVDHVLFRQLPLRPLQLSTRCRGSQIRRANSGSIRGSAHLSSENEQETCELEEDDGRGWIAVLYIGHRFGLSTP